MARLVDGDRSELQFQWDRWTADPKKAKKQVGRPPAHPPVAPYGARPPGLHHRVVAAYTTASKTPAARGSGRDRSGMRKASIEEIARLI